MRWWWRRHDVLSGSTQDGRSEHAPGRSMPGRVGASHTPPACRRQAHRIRQLPFSTLTRATPRHGPTGQRARRRRVPPRPGGDGSTTRRGTRRPRSLSSSCSLAALLLPFLFSSRAIEEADGGAEPSNPAASRRVALSRPGADSIRGGFWEGEEFPPVFIFFLFWGPGLCVG
jgi:hypothetical protein